MSVKCAVCGRRLTSPASIAAGVGPECGKRGKGRRHRSPYSAMAAGGGYNNGANGNGKVIVPPAVGQPMTRDEALEIVRKVAGL